ncbi:hypothetical protein QBC39DRAFT_386237 [Podospora conica]|nr:hypothetical protein QBC39DRAFT_386237 [Schizothecium conicum]
MRSPGDQQSRLGNKRPSRIPPSRPEDDAHTRSVPNQTTTQEARHPQPATLRRPPLPPICRCCPLAGRGRMPTPLRDACRTVAGTVRGGGRADFSPSGSPRRWPAFPAVWVLWCAVLLPPDASLMCAWVMAARGNRSHAGRSGGP